MMIGVQKVLVFCLVILFIVSSCSHRLNKSRQQATIAISKKYNTAFYDNWARSNLPTPPAGKKWVVENKLTDEFEGNELDTAKWKNQIENFTGVLNQIHLPEEVSVSNGTLNLGISWLDTPVFVKNAEREIGTGSVESIHRATFPIYTETMMKANDMPLSSSFWLYSNYSGEKPFHLKGCLNYFTELDVIETVAGPYDWAEKADVDKKDVKTKMIKNFNTKLQTATHFRTSDTCGDRRHKFYTTQPIGPDGKKFFPELGFKTNSGFHRYGVYWIDAKHCKIYVDGKNVSEVWFDTTLSSHPFDIPMNIEFNIQRFGWLPSPTKELIENAQQEDLVSRYEWIRTFKLVDK